MSTETSTSSDRALPRAGALAEESRQSRDAAGLPSVVGHLSRPAGPGRLSGREARRSSSAGHAVLSPPLSPPFSPRHSTDRSPDPDRSDSAPALAALAAPATAPPAPATAASPVSAAAHVDPSTGSSHPLPTTYAEADEFLGVLLDAVVAADRELAVVAARRAELVDQVRQWSRESVDALARARGKSRGSRDDHMIAARSTTAELACALRLPEGAVMALLVESEALVHELPATMTALREGALSYRHAQVVMSATAALDETPRLTLDTMLAERATTTTVANLGRAARRARERHDPRPLVDRHAVAVVERHVELEVARDGMAWLHQLLPAVQASAIFHRLSDLAAACQGPDEPRTLAQLRADACVGLLLDDDARSAATAGSVWSPQTEVDTTRGARSEPDATHPGPLQVSMRGIRPVVAVTVPVMTLLGRSDEPGDLAGYGPIDAVTARRLAAHAPSFLRLLTHPESGAVLSVGRDRYTVPADLRSWLKIRDETCRFPGCARRAERCDVDHVEDWAHGGTTSHDNLIHLCRKHHRLKHTSRWKLRTGGAAAGRGRSGAVHVDSSAARGTRGAEGTVGAKGTDSSLRPDTAHVTDDSPGSGSSGCPDGSTVSWDAPSGRSYVDHAAVFLQTPRRETGESTSRGARADRHAGATTAAGASITEGSTFDGPPPF